jgi:protein FAM50
LPPKKKRRAHALSRGKLSFGDALLDGSTEESSPGPGADTPGGESSEEATVSAKASPVPEKEPAAKKRLGPNSTVPITPKAMTKSALMREAQTREQLRKEFLALQELVKATEILIPFVFYDGTNIPGGVCKVKKGDHTWLFLDKARKVGAELGVGGAGERASSRREWARVGVDDLMMVRGEIIIPHVCHRLSATERFFFFLLFFSLTITLSIFSPES